MDRKTNTSSKKGTGFQQPEKAHKHWHVDISYLNLGGTFYFLISVLDGFSRYIVHWEIRERMAEQDVEIVVARALEKNPGVKPRIISNNGRSSSPRTSKSLCASSVSATCEPVLTILKATASWNDFTEASSKSAFVQLVRPPKRKQSAELEISSSITIMCVCTVPLVTSLLPTSWLA